MSTGPTGQLAFLVKATKWPGWSSSSQPKPSPLRNSLLPPREQDPVLHTPSQSVSIRESTWQTSLIKPTP